MRELLFRGFHPCDGPNTIVVDGERVKGRWVYGAAVRFRGLDNAPHTCIIAEIDGENIMNETVNVLPSTVGQYTGMKDKTEKWVFEGDILRIEKASDGLGGYYSPPLEYPVNVVVKWDMCAWNWETLGDAKYYISFPAAWCHYKCEVRGTIFDEDVVKSEQPEV